MSQSCVKFKKNITLQTYEDCSSLFAGLAKNQLKKLAFRRRARLEASLVRPTCRLQQA